MMVLFYPSVVLSFVLLLDEGGRWWVPLCALRCVSLPWQFPVAIPVSGRPTQQAHAEAEPTWMRHGPVQAAVTRLLWRF
jgi:hypothetical protein